MSGAAAPLLVDARGMRCPWPALRLARAARTIGGGLIHIAADDPAAPGELARLAEASGWSIDPAETVFGPGFVISVPVSTTA